MRPFDTAETDRLLTTTRAVRRRLDLTRPVDREVVMECLQLAVQAPTGSNRQRWRWVLVDDADLRQQLGDLYRKSYSELQPGYDHARAASTHERGQDTLGSAVQLAEQLHDVPVHVIPCTLDPLPPCPSLLEGSVFYGSILPAVWSFMLALRSRGLASSWTTIHLPYAAEAADLLGIPARATQVALIPVAHFTGDDFRPARRRPAEDVAAWNGWPARR